LKLVKWALGSDIFLAGNKAEGKKTRFETRRGVLGVWF